MNVTHIKYINDPFFHWMRKERRKERKKERKLWHNQSVTHERKKRRTLFMLVYISLGYYSDNIILETSQNELLYLFQLTKIYLNLYIIESRIKYSTIFHRQLDSLNLCHCLNAD